MKSRSDVPGEGSVVPPAPAESWSADRGAWQRTRTEALVATGAADEPRPASPGTIGEMPAGAEAKFGELADAAEGRADRTGRRDPAVRGDAEEEDIVRTGPERAGRSRSDEASAARRGLKRVGEILSPAAVGPLPEDVAGGVEPDRPDVMPARTE